MSDQMKYSIATGRSRHTTTWTNEERTWEELLQSFRDPVVTRETAAEYKGMSREKQTGIKDVGGFVGGYLADGRRKKDAIRYRTLLTLDYDEFSAGQLAALRDVMAQRWGCAWAVHSTHKHTDRAWRVRVIVPLSRRTDPDEYVAAARKVAESVGFAGIDRSTFEPCRLMFWPSRSADAPYLFESAGEEPLDVDRVLESYDDWADVSAWPMLPEESAVREATAPGKGDTQGRLERMGRLLGMGRRQQDPLAKRGVVGAFCRSYDIPAAIDTFLAHVYEPTRNPRKYTHVGSTGHGGAWVIDGKYLYSFHATDPACGRLLNAFDLVRVHLYEAEDAAAAPGTAADRLPSYKAMQTLALGDASVRRRLTDEKRAAAASDFDGFELDGLYTGDGMKNGSRLRDNAHGSASAGAPARSLRNGRAQAEAEACGRDQTWNDILATWDINKDGTPKSTINNVAAIVRHSPELSGRIAYNEFAMRVEVSGQLPWKRPEAISKKGKKQGRGKSKYWNNNDDTCLRAWLEKAYGITGKEKIFDGFVYAANERAFHPVKDYLHRLSWDGVERLQRVFCDILGAEDTPLYRYLPKLLFAGAVARIYDPGCKFDYFIILQGPEGTGKSSLFSIMGGEWFSDSVSTIEGKQGMEEVQGSWIIEMGELTSVKRSETSALKSFISRQVDSFRPAYGRTKEILPRQCVLVGTTNEELFLRGIDTGNRRSPVVEIRPRHRKEGKGTPEVLAWIRENRDQLWAEAKALYESDFPLFLPAELDKAARKTTEDHNLDIQNPLFGEVEKFLDMWLPDNWEEDYEPSLRRDYAAKYDPRAREGADGYHPRVTVTLPEILQEGLGMSKDDRNYLQKSREVGQYMNTLRKWEKKGAARTRLYGVQKHWKMKNPPRFGYTLNDL